MVVGIAIVVLLCLMIYNMEMLNMLLLLEFLFLCLLSIMYSLTRDYYFGLLLITFSSCEAVLSLSFLLYFSGEFQGFLSTSVAECERESSKISSRSVLYH